MSQKDYNARIGCGHVIFVLFKGNEIKTLLLKKMFPIKQFGRDANEVKKKKRKEAYFNYVWLEVISLLIN